MKTRTVLGAILVVSGGVLGLLSFLNSGEDVIAKCQQKRVAVAASQWARVDAEQKSFLPEKSLNERKFFDCVSDLKCAVRTMDEMREVELQLATADHDRQTTRLLLGIFGAALFLAGIIVLAPPKFPELEVTG